MAREDRGVDFITIDGGEGGTGAAPFAFADHVALPFKIGFSRVFAAFAERGVHTDLVWIGSGKLGFPETALLAFCLGADMVNVGREAMLAVGCIQAQRCHTGHCPTGVATQNAWLVRGLDPTDKAARLANYVVTLRKELTRLSHACGVEHPGLLTADHMEILDESFGSRPIREVFRAVRGLADEIDDVAVVYPVHPNPNVRGPAEDILSSHPRIHLADPLDYFDLVAALKEASLVLTDSGGIQEEAPTFGTPVLVLRDVTERPEGIDAGVAELVGTDGTRIAERARASLAGARREGRPNPYGDGRAGERIADIVVSTLTGRPRSTTDWDG